ncbi:MAG: DUF4129 domain-containing protein [Gemmatimonadales bacterium]|nr:MAG: DUF4129 domain-containing protein [Gemmatimonadales bacterium]
MKAAPVLAVIAAAGLLAVASREAPLGIFWEGGRANRMLLLLDSLPVLVLGAGGVVAYAALAGRREGDAEGTGEEAVSFRDHLREAFPLAAIGVTTAILALFSMGGFQAPEVATPRGVVEVPGEGFFRTPWGMSHWFEMGGVGGEGTEAAEGTGLRGTEGIGPGISLRGGLLLLAGALILLALWRWMRRKDGGIEAEDDAAREDRLAVEGAIHRSIEAMLADPDPNTAIRGAYARLLAALDERGRGRWEHEGPLEHLQRVLGTLRIRPAPLRELIALFELARFSPRNLTTTHRDRALLALREVAAGLESAP